MEPRFAFLLVAMFLVHLFILLFQWIEARARPMALRLGLISREAEVVHDYADLYHQHGLNTPSSLLASPRSIPRAEARRIERRIVVEMFVVVLSAAIPSSVLLAIATFLRGY
jgi:hypothetical protein